MWHKRVHGRLPYTLRKKLSPKTALLWASVAVLAVFALVTFELHQTIAGVLGPAGARGGAPASSSPRAFGPELVPDVMHHPPVRRGYDVRGSDPASARVSYVPDENGMVWCPKTLKLLPFDRINDDYCDCPADDEASDEPGTGACPRGRFFCSREQTWIASYRVNDGMCDCCDGADEWSQGQRGLFEVLSREVQARIGRYQASPVCPNTCH